MPERYSTTFFKRANVLVVDDEDISRAVTGSQLESEGYTVIEADSGAAALEKLNSSKVDLVLLDVVMPGMDGYQLCSLIKQDLRFVTLPVVFVTSLHDHESRIRALDAGCDDFLNKPPDPSEIKTRVRNLLRVKAYHDMRNQQREMLEQELEHTREQLLRADRLITLGTLAAGTGHELNNILSVLQMTVDLMRKRGEQPPRESDLARLETVVGHIGVHSRTLLNYGRPGPQQDQKCNLGDLVSQTLELLRISGRVKNTTIEYTRPQERATVEVCPSRIEQVLINLVFNAVDAVASNSGKPRLVKIEVGVQPDGHAICSVKDNGCGIPADKLGEIFDPYYTTKPVGKGTGLGLPVVRTIIESYKGQVLVSSSPGEGTTMSFTLPLCVI